MNLWNSLITNYVKRGELLKKDKENLSFEEDFLVRPFITISREAGSGGKPIAIAVAKALKFKFYNKKIIELTSEKTKKRKYLIESLDEKDRGFVDDLVHSLLNPEYITEDVYIKNLFKVVASIARKGNSVILGRGGNFITSKYGGLHIRIVSPFLVRAGCTSKYENLTLYDARKSVEKIDRSRKNFIKQYFGKDASNANHYDLVINTTYLNIEQVKEIVICAFKRKFPNWKEYL